MTILAKLFPPPSAAPIPRGIARQGPAILSYGFRPFFLCAGIWAVTAMSLWLGAVLFGWELGGSYGAINWHAHELLFGYAAAVLAGFMLTAIPNWTGRLPLSGNPLLALVALWLAGRIAMLLPDLLGMPPAIAVDSAFLPAMAFVAAREIIAGKNWKNLKVLAGLGGLALANIGFHVAVLGGWDTGYWYRAAISVLVMLIAVVGGRIVPSFSRNWLARRSQKLPAAFDWIDRVALVSLAVALACWVVEPLGQLTALLCAVGAATQAWRLLRWRSWSTRGESIVFVLHAAFAFIPIGLIANAAAAVGAISEISALHLLTVGAIGVMTLAVMSRATLGHTGNAIVANWPIRVSYLALIAAALIRPAADSSLEWYYPVLALSGGLWLLAFSSFLVGCGPLLVSARKGSR